MFATALQNGLRAWVRAPISASFATGVALGLLVIVYALAVQISGNRWVVFGLWGILANLVLAGWALYCLGQVDRRASWRALLFGFRKPIALTGAGVAAICILAFALIFVYYLLSALSSPTWARSLGWISASGLLAPFGVLAIMHVARGESLGVR